MTESEQKQLITLAKSGDIPAFEKLIKMNQQTLHSFALSISGGNETVANDILQEALLNAFLYIKNFKETCSFTSWLWKITRNEFLKFQNNPQKSSTFYVTNKPEMLIEAEDNLESELIEDEKRKNLRRLISQLDIKEQEVISLIDLQHMNYDEASDTLDVSLTALKSRVRRARKKIFKLVEENKQLFL